MTRAWIGFVPLFAYVCILSYGCGVTPAQHAANVGEATQATAEYEQCRDTARDGGTFASFCACVRTVDAKHHIDGGPCE